MQECNPRLASTPQDIEIPAIRVPSIAQLKGGKTSSRLTYVEAKLPVEPNYLLGRQVLVKWDDGKWYNGIVNKFDYATFEHEIAYDDGDEERLVIGLHIPIKVSSTSREQLPLPTPQQLEKLSSLLLELAEKDDAAATRAAGPSERRKKQSEADRKRQKAQELLQLAEDTMSTATTPGSPATKLESAVKPSNVLFNNQQQVTEGLLRGPLAEKGSSTGELSQALVAAQKLLTGMHPSNVPGLSFTKVVWPWQKVGPNLSTVDAQRQLDQQRQQQQPDASMGSELLCLEQELASSFELHQQTKQDHAHYFKELDVSLRVSPDALVGRDVRVYWQLDDAWFLGIVDQYDPQTAQHRVSYKDGTVEQYWLGTERVRLLHSPGEQLPTPTAEVLHQLAQKYVEQARWLEDQQQQHRTLAQGSTGSAVMAVDEDSERPSLLRSKAQLLLSAAHIKQHNLAPEMWVPAAAKLKGASSGPDNSKKPAAAGRSGWTATTPAYGGSGAGRGTATSASGVEGSSSVMTTTAATGGTVDSACVVSPGQKHASGSLKKQQKHQPPQRSKRQLPVATVNCAAAGEVAGAATGAVQKRQKTSSDIANMATDAAHNSGTDHTAAAVAGARPSVLQELQQQHLHDIANDRSKHKVGQKPKRAPRKEQQQEQKPQQPHLKVFEGGCQQVAGAAQQAQQSMLQPAKHQQKAAAAAANPKVDTTDASFAGDSSAASRAAGMQSADDKHVSSDGGAGGSGVACCVEVPVLPGDVVWVQSRGNPPWPAIVISSEEATDWSIPLRLAKLPQVCVQYFGEYARARVHPSSILPPCIAVDQRVWIPTLLSKTKHKLVDQYRLAIRELIEYCKTGILPDPEMVPEHHDDRWFQCDDEAPANSIADEMDIDAAASDVSKSLASSRHRNSRTAAASSQTGGLKVMCIMDKDLSSKLSKLGGKLGGSASLSGSSNSSTAAADKVLKDLRAWAAQLVASQSAAAGCSAAGPKTAQLPVQITGNLILLSLGRVEFLHPGFHSERFIYPVGFSVMRKAKSPASAGAELWHLCEILEHPSGSGPMFRITPDGGKPASGSSPTAAWEQLYKLAIAGATSEAPAPAARGVSTCGAKMFGLQHPAVQAVMQALPGAAACDRFIAWQGERPPPVHLTPELQLAKRAIATKLLSLPIDITPLPLSRRMVSACDACGDEIEVEDNLLVECDKCRVVVHMRCYGLSKPPDGSSWLCDVCRLPGLSSHPPCSLCPRLGGAMKVTADGGWCHLMCATWLPGMCVADAHKMEPIMGRVHKDHRSLLCGICKQPYGACIQCAGSSRCYAAFHPTCARDAGYAMMAVYDEDSDSEEDVAAATGARAAPAEGLKQQQLIGGIGKGCKHSRRPKKVRKEGTAAGDNTRLFCFCPKHRHKAAGLERSMVFETTVNPGPAAATASTTPASRHMHSGPGSSLQPTGNAAGSASADVSAAVAAAGGGQEVTSPRSAGTAAHEGSGHAAAAPKAAGVSLFGGHGAAGTCARTRPADTAVRRGLRAPDVLAAAIRKRQYVQALPYLVTCSTQAGQLLPPPAIRSRTVGPEFRWDCCNRQEQQQQQQEHFSWQQCSSLQHDTLMASSSVKSSEMNAAVLTTGRQELHPQVKAAVANTFPGCSAVCDSGKSSVHHMSLADRYCHMTATVVRRISSGKSAIHGLGVFAKVPHKAGDMIVEYIGHLVRPRVADILEARTYNQLVGAGTYVFRLNDRFLVDATRAGNIAHLINHSCAACCVSKTYTIQCPASGQRRDHVVIVAKRDIAVGEELTYDYRFAGDERLRCNCGAATCRGWVNTPSSFDSPMKRSDGSLLVPCRELVPVRQTADKRPASAHALF